MLLPDLLLVTAYLQMIRYHAVANVPSTNSTEVVDPPS